MKPNLKRDLVVIVFCLMLAVSSSSFGQGPPPGGEPGRGGPPGFGGPGGPGGFSGGGGVIGLVARDEVQQELQLVDEQKEKVRGIAEETQNKARDEMRELFSEMRDLSDDERRAKFGELRPKMEAKMEALTAESTKQLEKVLLPHQLDRLRQIDLQTKMRYRGAGALTGGDVAKALNLTEEQREKLEKRAAEVQEELQTKIKQLQADARKKMLDVLTPDQQAQLEKMMGQQFEMPEQSFRDRFRGRGGRDGRDGRPSGEQPGQEESKAGKEAI
jgi:Spy/CpxP family protein refolding chaperone